MIVLLLSLMRQIWVMCSMLGTSAQENRDRLLGVLQQNSGEPGCRDQHIGKLLCPGGAGVERDLSVLGCFRKVFRNSCLLVFYMLLLVVILFLNAYFNAQFNYVLLVS